MGQVWLCGGDGKPRWQFSTGHARPWDVQLLPEGRVLVAGLNGQYVSEFDTTGKFHWRAAMYHTRMGYRLSDGNTFVASHSAAGVVTPAGTWVYTVKDLGREDPNQHLSGLDIAPRFGGRRLIFLSELLVRPPLARDTRLVRELEGRSGRVLREFRFRSTDAHFHVDPVAGGHCLVSGDGIVREFDPAGQVVWQFRRKQPTRATRLRNGLTVATADGGWPHLVEVDRAGKVTWEAFPRLECRGARPCLRLVRFGFEGHRPAGLDLAPDHPDRVKFLIEAMLEPDPWTRAVAHNEFTDLGALMLPYLSQYLKDDRPSVRVIAVGLLCLHKDQGKRCVPAILEALGDADGKVRAQAVLSLGAFPAEAKNSAPHLARILEQAPDKVMRENAVRSLFRLGPDAEASLPALRQAAKNDDLEFRLSALGALARVGPRDKATAQALIAVLEDEKETLRTRTVAAGTLGSLKGEAAQLAVPHLLKTLDTQEGATPKWPIKFREEVLLTLGMMGAEAREAVPTLTKLYRDPKTELPIRRGVILSFRYMARFRGSPAKDLVPVLKEALKDSDERIRIDAEVGLSYIER